MIFSKHSTFLSEDSFLLNTRFNENTYTTNLLVVVLCDPRTKEMTDLSIHEQEKAKTALGSLMKKYNSCSARTERCDCQQRSWKTSPSLSSSTCSTSQPYR
jgi:hypothetical protein